MAFAQVTLEGFKKTEAKFLSLEKKVAKGIVRKAVRAGAKPINEGIKDNAKSIVGGEMGALIAKNIITRVAKKQKKGQYKMNVLIKKDVPEFISVAASGKESYIPAAIEYGHAIGSSLFRSSKTVPAIPFARMAAASKKKEAIKEMANKFKTGLETT